MRNMHLYVQLQLLTVVIHVSLHGYPGTGASITRLWQPKVVYFTLQMYSSYFYKLEAHHCLHVL